MNDKQSSVERLRLTAFEELMLDQDSPQHACVICVRCDLSGNLDVQRLEQALRAIVQRHPLLRAKVEMRWGKLWWAIEPVHNVMLHVHECSAPAWPLARCFDLLADFGIHFDLFRPSPTKDSIGSAAGSSDTEPSTLFLQVHHAIADGLGTLQIVQELLIEYNSVQQPIEPATTIPLRDRNRFGLTLVKVLELIPKQFVGLAGVRQYLTRHPVPMSPRVVPVAPSKQVTALHYRCSSAQSQQLKQMAKDQQATLNDWLTCLMFEAQDQYRRTQTRYRASDWLRVMIPISLREANSPPVCNVVSCVFLDRTGEQISDRVELLKSIHAEMDLIKRNRLALLFIFSLWIKKVLRFRRRRQGLMASPPSRCQTSFVFSNMGKLFDKTPLSTTPDGKLKAGEVTLESCEVLAPVAPLMSLAITTFQYAGRITISLHYDSAVFAAADAEQLLKLMVERLHGPQGEPVQA